MVDHSRIYLGDRVIDTTKFKKESYVLKYKVFGSESSPWASELEIESLAAEAKQKIVDYLQNRAFYGANFLQGPLTDAFTGKLMLAKGDGFMTERGFGMTICGSTSSIMMLNCQKSSFSMC